MESVERIKALPKGVPPVTETTFATQDTLGPRKAQNVVGRSGP